MAKETKVGKGKKVQGIKCCHNNCDNASIGFFTGSNYGLWLCHLHKKGECHTTIETAINDPSKAWLFDKLDTTKFKKFRHQCDNCKNAEVWAQCYWDSKCLCLTCFKQAWRIQHNGEEYTPAIDDGQSFCEVQK